MNRVSILDCTLRDGGYINNFQFGAHNIENIIYLLGQSGIDIIECGFLRAGNNDENQTLYNSVAAIKKILGNKQKEVMYVAMLQCGKIGIEDIDIYDGASIDGIRVTFHEHEIEEAFVICRQLMEKGYKVFVQPVGTSSYSDNALLQLIAEVNALKPYAFYLVDTLGTMYQKDIRRFYYLIDHNLDKHIKIGFHSHNNLQLAFSNAQELMQMNTPRQIIIDATVQGLGRGAGNLCTELILQYINENVEYTYDMLPILKIIDEYISVLHTKYTWGYSMAYYLAAIKQCHPNYATFLLNMQTLQAEDINHILDMMSAEKRTLYDEDYISQIYTEYKSCWVDDQETLRILQQEIAGREVLLLAPGKSIKNITNKWAEELEKRYYIISINFLPEYIECNRHFFSNEKRFMFQGQKETYGKLLLTSNIKGAVNQNVLSINYSSYLNDDIAISDNAGLMCINLMIALEVKRIALIGFDGFDMNQVHNYVSDALFVNVDVDQLQKMNKSIARSIQKARKSMDIVFLTKSQYDMS